MLQSLCMVAFIVTSMQIYIFGEQKWLVHEAGGSVRAQGQFEEHRESLQLGVEYVSVIPALVRSKEDQSQRAA